jgi:hypothetical protein
MAARPSAFASDSFNRRTLEFRWDHSYPQRGKQPTTAHARKPKANVVGLTNQTHSKARPQFAPRTFELIHCPSFKESGSFMAESLRG